MKENIFSKNNSIIGSIVLVVILVAGYYFYTTTQDAPPSAGKVDPTLFSNKEVVSFYSVKDSINLKDTSFKNKAFYANLKDYTVEIPSVEPTGRPNPFWAP
jgi:hypothetical protein